MRLHFTIYNTDELQVSNLSVLVWMDRQRLEQEECAEPVVLYTVICAYQCSSLWWEENKSAKQQQIHKIPQVALFIYLHLPGLPAAKSRWHTLARKLTVCKM